MTDRSDTLQTRIIELERQLHLREYEIALLKETADAITSELDFEKLLQLIAERARTLIEADTLLIPILDRECEHYTYRAGCGRNADEIVGETLPIDFGVCGWVWRHQRPWWRGTLNELSPMDRNRWEREVGTMIMVPLVGKVHFLGGIAGLNKTEGREFDRRDLDLLTLFAHQVSISMENALNYAALDAAKTQAETYQLELHKLNSELEHLALYDSLTELPNRSLIMDRLEQALLSAARDVKPLAIIMADLDHFKEVNDSLGHAVGDNLLQAVGARLKAGVRKSDTVGRLGGDEFAIVMPHADVHAAVSVAMELQRTLESPFELDAASISIAASMGIAMYPDHGNDTVTLLKHADVAMYTAKRTKNGYAVYNINEDDSTAGKLGRLGELRNALQSNEFMLYYQPILDLTTGKVIGTEALTRWPRKDRSMIMPDEFIPALEQTGLIRPFTLWVIDSALAQCAAWHKLGYDLSVAVNISAHSLLDAQLSGQIADFIERWAVPADALVLEITESAFMGDVPRVQRILSQIRDLGVRISIDDFGTGYSSLAHLKRLPVGELKIDRSFVMNMQNAGDDATIVHSTVDLAHNLGLRVVAEGVEDNDILQLLADLGCDMIQGYHICRPMPPDEMLEFLHKGRWRIAQFPQDRSNKSG